MNDNPFEFCESKNSIGIKCGDVNYNPHPEYPGTMEPSKYKSKYGACCPGHHGIKRIFSPIFHNIFGKWYRTSFLWKFSKIECFNHYMASNYGLYAVETPNGTAYIDSSLFFGDKEPIIKVEFGNYQWEKETNGFK